MAKVNLNGKTRTELERLLKDIDAEVARREKQNRKDALKAARAAAAAYGSHWKIYLPRRKAGGVARAVRSRRSSRIRGRGKPGRGWGVRRHGTNPMLMLENLKLNCSSHER